MCGAIKENCNILKKTEVTAFRKPGFISSDQQLYEGLVELNWNT